MTVTDVLARRTKLGIHGGDALARRPPLMMFKALLQSWYKLSDPQLEKQLARD